MMSRPPPHETSSSPKQKRRRLPYMRRTASRREQIDRKLRHAGLRYLVEVVGFSVLAFIGTALFLNLPVFHVRPIALTWDELADATYTNSDGTEALHLHDITVKLDKRPIALRGFVALLGDEFATKHFFLTAKQPACPRCVPPDSKKVEVLASSPIRYSRDLIVVSGRLSAIPNAAQEVSYSLLDATLVEQ